MVSRLISIVMTFPYRFAHKGSTGYFAGQIVTELLVLLMTVVWLIVPFALWQAIGFGWMRRPVSPCEQN